MLNNISWASYWYALTILLLIYYVYVLLVYYRSDIMRLRARRHAFAANPLPSFPISELNSDDELLPVVQSFNEEMTAYLDQASHGQPEKPEVIFSLQQIVKKYPGIRGSAFQDRVNQLIEFECKDKCGIHLSEDEVRQVWLV